MSPLRLYNSMTQKKEEFVPIRKGKVGMYVCGITAYDACHLGHARAAVAFDLIFRTLKHKGFKVTYVRNFTDIDDKIINRANEASIPLKDLTERYIKEYGEDMALLNVEAPTVEPKATEHIDAMIKMIGTLIKNKKAYELKGNVYFSVRDFKDYGKLSHKNIEELQSGSRMEIDENKRDPLDFALWKRAKPGEPKWPSPWGEGRPGWHIECSAMSTQYLHQPFDIHGGGQDLLFPHHENEIAQVEGARKKKYCNYFLHNGHLNIHSEKMSKSTGNFLTIKDVVAKHGAEVVRFFLISSQYGSKLDYTEENMAEAKAALDRFYLFEERLSFVPVKMEVKELEPATEAQRELAKNLKEVRGRFNDCMDDNFNTAGGLGVLFETIRCFNKFLDQEGQKPSDFLVWARTEWEKVLFGIKNILGVFHSDAKKYFRCQKELGAKTREVDVAWIEQKIEERRRARMERDFARGDALRDELARLGVELKDSPDGSTTWSFKTVS